MGFTPTPSGVREGSASGNVCTIGNVASAHAASVDRGIVDAESDRNMSLMPLRASDAGTGSVPRLSQSLRLVMEGLEHHQPPAPTAGNARHDTGAWESADVRLVTRGVADTLSGADCGASSRTTPRLTPVATISACPAQDQEKAGAASTGRTSSTRSCDAGDGGDAASAPTMVAEDPLDFSFAQPLFQATRFEPCVASMGLPETPRATMLVAPSTSDEVGIVCRRPRAKVLSRK